MKLFKSKRGTIILSNGEKMDDKGSIAGVVLSSPKKRGGRRGYGKTWKGSSFNITDEIVEIEIDNKNYFLIGELLFVARSGDYNNCFIDLKNKVVIQGGDISRNDMVLNKKSYMENIGKMVILKNGEFK
ncbi:MAG: hypothetical protein SLAVMIC_00756 [uncultured marine phage]|uniref:Uncharacterized protein n=1 Tax=uncultured marine phage TaxID=707152 RepID=A0A8D9CFP5_9VIRU|nr:MAG: hypothetical protein SLAVMIC_00756 [uncultured marine phage]